MYFRQKELLNKDWKFHLLYLLSHLLQLCVWTSFLGPGFYLFTCFCAVYKCSLSLSHTHTHTHTHTHVHEHTPMHTQSPKMLSISYVPDTIILFNPYNGVPPWPSHSPWAESLSHSCTTCPLNLCVTHIYPLLHATSLLGPPLCPLGTQGLSVAWISTKLATPLGTAPLFSFWFHLWGKCTSMRLSLPAPAPP